MNARRAVSTISLVLCASLATPALAQPKADVPVTEDAKRHFKAGVDFLNDPDGARYEEAFRAFNRAYAASPSWKILGNLGLSAMKLERFTDAIDAYERYLAGGGSEIGDAERAQVTRDVGLMKGDSATVTLTASGAGEVALVDQRQRANGSTAVNSYAIPASGKVTLRLQAGRHVVTAKRGAETARWEVELSAGQVTEKRFDFHPAGAGAASPTASASAAPVASAPPPAEPSATPPPPARAPLRTAGLVTMGVGGAMILGGVITGLMGKSKLSDVEASCTADRCPPSSRGDADSVERLEKITNVLWIGGAVVAGAGAAMFVIGGKKKEGAALRVTPSVGPGGAGLTIGGRL
ncbi:MAG: hypothetical protein IT374_28485 [Polyangiaceae bacterium]|nr:hypothetical protein [Polyangiaceae bacterium]